MAVKFFGQFLLEKGAVTKESLLKAIELQESTNLKFGETALGMGILTAADIERVHDAQQSEDLRFGDMALKLGLISDEQMQQVLTRQKNNHLYIGEALIKVGGLSAEALPRYLEEFKADQAPYLVQRVSIPDGIPSPEIWEMVADLTYKMLTRVADIAIRPGPCRVVEEIAANTVVAAMEFQGSIRGRYLFSASSNAQKAIARAILKEEDVESEPTEVLDDTVMEFANIVLGNVAAKTAQLGKNMEIAPPEVINPGPDGIKVPSGMTGLLFPIHVADGDCLEMAVFIGA